MRNLVPGAVDVVEHDEHLRDDLAGRHLAPDVHLRRHTEGTSDRAADLRADADRVAARLGDEDGLDGLAVSELEQVAARSVRRSKHASNARLGHRMLGRQPLSERLRKVGHPGRVEHAAAVYGVVDLSRAKPRLAERGDDLRDLLTRFAYERHPSILP